jgi:hypothetical protein
MTKPLHPLLQPGEGVTEALERQAAEIERLRAAADPRKITSAVLGVMAKGGDNLAIFNAVKGALEQSP